LFQAESRRCKEIIDVVSKTQKETTPNTVQTRHFCIFDELYSGTNPLEATKSAYAFLKYLSNYDNVDFVLTTHYVSVCKRLKKYKQIKNYKMDVLPHATDENSCEYTYKIKSGISNVQGAFQILKDMNYPKEILDSMREDTWKKRKSEN
jgi:DNA mismatch repair ATPase MutS